MALALHYQGSRTESAAPLSEAQRITDFDVMPWDLVDKVSRAKRLDIQEPLSFPFEDLPTSAWSIPFTIHLPPEGAAGSDAESLIALLGQTVLARLTVLDTVSTSDDTWTDLQQRYGWPNWMRVGSDSFSTNTEVRDTEAIETKLAEHGHNPYDNFWIRTAQSKQRLLAISAVVEQTLMRVRNLHFRDLSVQLHGCQTAAFVPMMWSGLDAVVENNPAGRHLLKKNYPVLPFELLDLGARSNSQHKMVESADIIVGVGNLRQTGADQIQNAFETMFGNLRVGGALVICERLNGAHGPNDLLEILLDASNHNLVMDDMESIKVSSDESLGYAVMAFSKLGTPKR